MNARMKSLALRAFKALGLFRLAATLTRHDLRILCYHGIAIDDEHRFRPGLFMRPETFRARMDWLEQQGYGVISLDEACRRHAAGERRPRQAVITIDDGWHGSFEVMAAELARRGYPATLYLCTFFFEHPVPIFNVALSYLFWKHRRPFRFSSDSALRPADSTANESWDERRLSALARGFDSEQEQALLEEVAGHFGEDLSLWRRSRKLHYLDRDSAQALPGMGIDLELHTHTHRFPADDKARATREIERNRAVIEALTGTRARHFCYPSGEYQPHQFAWLEALDVASATTTHNEVVKPGDNPLCLSRIVDSERYPLIEFEAEMTGFMSLLRNFRRQR